MYILLLGIEMLIINANFSPFVCFVLHDFSHLILYTLFENGRCIGFQNLARREYLQRTLRHELKGGGLLDISIHIWS